MMNTFRVHEKLQRSKWHNRRLITQQIPPTVGGPDWRLPPAPGTNQIAQYSLLTRWEKINSPIITIKNATICGLLFCFFYDSHRQWSQRCHCVRFFLFALLCLYHWLAYLSCFPFYAVPVSSYKRRRKPNQQLVANLNKWGSPSQYMGLLQQTITWY